MKLQLPIPIDQIISNCVEAVQQRILPQLITANPRIRSLSFMFGHPLELKNTLKLMSEDPEQRYNKFPVIMLFADVMSSPSSVRGAYSDVNLNMVIAMSTEAEYDAAKRSAVNFDPILRPIYQEFIQEIARCGYFWVQSTRQILGRDIERFYWGKEGIQGNAGNQFNDFIDAIEIKNLKLTLSRKGNALVQNTFMQLVDYFLQNAKAKIVIGSVTGNTINNTFFMNVITEITTETQDYIAGVDFTQALDTNGNPTGAITGIYINFYTGQTIIAKR